MELDPAPFMRIVRFCRSRLLELLNYIAEGGCGHNWLRADKRYHCKRAENALHPFIMPPLPNVCKVGGSDLAGFGADSGEVALNLNQRPVLGVGSIELGSGKVGVSGLSPCKLIR